MKSTVMILLLAVWGATLHAETLVIGSDGVTPGTSLPDVPVGSYIRSDQPTSMQSNKYLLVGELDNNRGSMRGALSFDLSALSTIPTGSTITAVTVSLFQDQSTAGSGGSPSIVNIQLFSMTGAVTPSATWNNTSGLFGTLLASDTGNTTSVSLNAEFVFSSPALTQYLLDSAAGGTLDLGVMAPELEVLTDLPASEYFTFDGPDAIGRGNSVNSIGPSLRVEYRSDGGGGGPTDGTRPDGGIVINELHIDPDLSYELVEFIELYNSKDEAIDISRWSFRDGVSYTFPPGTIIDSGEYIVITEDETVRTVSPTTSVQNKYGTDPALIYGPFAGRLDNDGETIELRDDLGHPIDEVDYQLGFPWPTVGDGVPNDAAGNGHSMQLMHDTLDNDLAGSWRSAYPTPGAQNTSVYATNIPPQIRQVKHTPEEPLSTNTITVSAKVTDADGISSVTLLYQVVTPGNYVRLTDASYNTWSSVAMNDGGANGDLVAGDDTFTAELPAGVQVHRNLVRYRIQATDATLERVTVPYTDDPQPNFALCIYDGVPGWSGADNPGAGDPVTAFSEDTMGSLPAYHLIATESDVLACQYNGSFESTRFHGTMVHDGEVYDHIEFKIRGEYSTYLSGKNKWKFFFTRGHNFQARDDYGKKYDERLRRLSVSACAAPYNAVHRGSVGMDEALAFRLFNMAGTPAPKTHYFQLRVIDDAVETDSSSQYEGDLWGVYMNTEFPDGRFLDEHGLPDGNTFKMEGGADQKHQGATQPINGADLSTFRSTYSGSNPSVSWWEANLDLEAYFGFRAVLKAVNNMDMADNRNFYWYHNSETDQWVTVPWDLDNMYLYANSSHVSVGVKKCLNHSSIEIAYDNYLRELQDLLFTREQMTLLVEELASIIDPPNLTDTMVGVEQNMWNYHPRTKSTPSWSVHRGSFYKNPATRTSSSGSWSYTRWLATADFEGTKHFYKDFVSPPAGAVTTHNSTWAHWNGWEGMDAEFSNSGIPDTPTVHYVGAAGFPGNALLFQTSAFNDPGDSFAAMKWRIAQLESYTPPFIGTGGTPSTPCIPGKYEIDAHWVSADITTFNGDIQIPGNGLAVGSTYRVRCKMKDSTGRWSHWSAPVEFAVGSADVTVWQDNLVIAELMYHPTDPTGSELLVTTDQDDFEFIELWNTNDVLSLDLTGLTFTDGVSFSFAGGAITNLGPQQRVLVVRSIAAFEARYGTGLPVAGEYAGKLSNDGEQVTLSLTGGTVIHDLTYGDSEPWPGRADGKGSSLEMLNATLGHGDPSNWGASIDYQGSPGNAGTAIPVGIVINEVLTHTDPPLTDAIELFNPTAAAIDLGGWFLSDSDTPYRKFRIPPGTVLAAGAYMTFDETNHFNTSMGSNITDFALDGAHGDDVWLTEGDVQGEVVSFVDYVEFRAARNGESFGRWPDGVGDMYPMRERTFDARNTGPRVGPVVISEFMYASPTADPDHEFVEILNTGAVLENLSGWRISGDVNFSLPSNTVLPAGQVLLVLRFDPADSAHSSRLSSFLAQYGVDPGARMTGGLLGPLPDGGGTLRLLRPDAPPAGEPGFVPMLLEDEVNYEAVAPWPPAAAGTGPALMRRGPTAWGNDPESWDAPFQQFATPGDTPYADGDGDDLPDMYEWETYGSTNVVGAGDTDGDGAGDRNEYVAGTSSTNANDRFVVHLGRMPGGGVALEMETRPVSGLGYFGLKRVYGVEEAGQMDPPEAWGLVPGHADLPATGAPVVYAPPAEEDARFFRGRVSLEQSP